MEKNVEEYLNKRTKDIANEWRSRHRTLVEGWRLTPIEALFFIEWAYQMYKEKNVLTTSPKTPSLKTFWLQPQYDIVIKTNKYRVDFLIQYAVDWDPNDKKTALLLELDSYFWHGKTPEQFKKEKKRERKLVQAGYKIMRFSGSEIVEHVEKYIDEVIQFLRG